MGERNGPPYPLKNSQKSAEERYLEGNSAKTKIEPDRSSKGLSEKQKKVLILAGAVAASAALTIAGTYAIKAHGFDSHLHWSSLDFTPRELTDYSDVSKVIPSGTKFQRIMSTNAFNDCVTKGERAYVSYTKNDNGLYMHTMPRFIKKWEGEGIIESSTPYVAKMKCIKDIKVASDRDAVAAFMKVNGYSSGDSVKDGRFQQFIKGLAGKEQNALTTAFYEELKSKGFNALKDYNDSSWAEDPLIVIDPASVFQVTNSRQKSVFDEIITVLKS